MAGEGIMRWFRPWIPKTSITGANMADEQKCEPNQSGRRCKAHDYLPLYPDGVCSVGRVLQASGALAIVRAAKTDLDEAYHLLTGNELSADSVSFLIRAKIKVDNAIRLIESKLEETAP